MHILAQGSDPIVGAIMNGRRCEGRRTGTNGRLGEDPAQPQPGMLRRGRLVGARLHPSSVGDEPRLPSACRAAQTRAVLVPCSQPAAPPRLLRPLGSCAPSAPAPPRLLRPLGSCAPSAPASPKGLRSVPAARITAPPAGGEKALLPSCGRLLKRARRGQGAGRVPALTPDNRADRG